MCYFNAVYIVCFSKFSMYKWNIFCEFCNIRLGLEMSYKPTVEICQHQIESPTKTSTRNLTLETRLPCSFLIGNEWFYKQHLTEILSLLNSVSGVGGVGQIWRGWRGWCGSIKFWRRLCESRRSIKFGMCQNVGQGQKKYSSRSVSFKFIASVPYMYFLFLTFFSLYSLCPVHIQIGEFKMICRT